MPAGEPFICPGKKDRPRRATADHTVEMPDKDLRLHLFRLANGIEAELAENERFVLGEVLQPGEILFEIALPLEINIERAEIDILRQQILRRRIARVGIKRPRIDLAGGIDQRL